MRININYSHVSHNSYALFKLHKVQWSFGTFWRLNSVSNEKKSHPADFGSSSLLDVYWKQYKFWMWTNLENKQFQFSLYTNRSKKKTKNKISNLFMIELLCLFDSIYLVDTISEVSHKYHGTLFRVVWQKSRTKMFCILSITAIQLLWAAIFRCCQYACAESMGENEARRKNYGYHSSVYKWFEKKYVWMNEWIECKWDANVIKYAPMSPYSFPDQQI